MQNETIISNSTFFFLLFLLQLVSTCYRVIEVILGAKKNLTSSNHILARVNKLYISLTFYMEVNKYVK